MRHLGSRGLAAIALLLGCGGSGAGGAAGTTGSAGTTGAAGTTGRAGATGSAGTRGGAGVTGTAGAAGSAGASGAAGSAGATGAAGTTGAGGSHTNPLSQSLIDAFVNAHNQARSGPLNPTPAPALPPVTWDYVLADSAYNYTTKCIAGTGGLIAHNANRTQDYMALGGKDSYVGENIYASTGNSVQPSDAVDSWMSEASSYNYATNNISAAGHYTQVVWRDSVRIGCAIYNCPSSSTLMFHNTILCDYAPGGNITNQKPY